MRIVIYTVSLITLLIVIVGCGAFSHMASFAIVKPHRCNDAESRKYFTRGITPQEYNLSSKSFEITVRDSIPLKGWLVKSAIESSNGTILVVHGIGSCKEHQVGLSEVFALEGYDTIIFDLPAHGKSGGIYTTYGYYEKHDISELIDSLDAGGELAKPLGIFGNSLGGAISLQVMAEDDRFRCGVIESTFATLNEIAYDYMNRAFRPATRGMIESALSKAGKLANFDPDSVRPEEAAKKIEQPVLMIHGEEDAHVSIDYGKRIFDNLASNKKEWYPIPGGTHDNLWQAGGEPYKQAFLGFFEKHMKREAAITEME